MSHDEIILETVAKKERLVQWGRKVIDLKWVEILFKVSDYIYFETNNWMLFSMSTEIKDLIKGILLAYYVF